MHPQLKVRMERRQIMAFALHQSQQILQMTQLELAEWMKEELERNPLLEESQNYKKSSTYKPTPEPVAKKSLRDHLLSQARERFPKKYDLNLASRLIDQLDDRGWLTTPLSELGEDTQSLENILAVIKTFDPPGIGAAHLQESYLLQLRAKSYSLAELLIRDHFQDLVNSRFTAIQKKLRLTSSDLQETLHTLSRLPMHPAALFDQSAERPLIADLSIQELEDRWILHIGEEELPLIHLNTDYLNLFATMHRGDEKDTMKSWITSARWLQRCVKRRKDTLNRIGRLLIKTQTAFLQNTGELKPLGIDDLARYLNVHESTAWRAIAHKTLSCPQGLIPLQQFFSDSSKADGVKNLLKILINQEDKSSPYTDDDLVRELSQKGVACARRTIAKYRKLLKLGPAHQRKSLGT